MTVSFARMDAAARSDATRRLVGCFLSTALLVLSTLAVVVAVHLTAGLSGCYPVFNPTRGVVYEEPKWCPTAADHDGTIADVTFIAAFLCWRFLARGVGPSVPRVGTLLLFSAFFAGYLSADLVGRGAAGNVVSLVLAGLAVVVPVFLQVRSGTAPSLLFGSRTLAGARYMWRGGDAGPSPTDVAGVLGTVIGGTTAALVASLLVLAV